MTKIVITIIIIVKIILAEMSNYAGSDGVAEDVDGCAEPDEKYFDIRKYFMTLLSRTCPEASPRLESTKLLHLATQLCPEPSP